MLIFMMEFFRLHCLVNFNCKNSFPLIVTTIVSYITEDKNVGKGVCPSLKDYRSMGLEYQIFYFSP